MSITLHNFCFILLTLINFTSGVYVFDVFKALQYQRGDQTFGSQRVSLSNPAATLAASDLSRQIAIVLVEELSSTSVLDNILNERHAEALLIVLPTATRLSAPPPEVLQKWLQIERHLMSLQLKIPVYFAFKDQTLGEIVEEINAFSRDSTNTVTYHMYVSDAEGVALVDSKAENFRGWLAGRSNVVGDNLPSVAILAHYDSLAVAPDLATGEDSNGSGVVGLLELARLFAHLYRGARSQAKYNLFFVLTGAGFLNYGGAEHWLSNEARDSYQFAVCLDTIGSAGKLYVHHAKSENDPVMKSFLSSFEVTARHHSVPIDFVHKKINISDPVIQWQHEIFSRFTAQKIMAITVSSLASPGEQRTLARPSIFDRSTVDLEALSRNIKVIGEALVRSISNFPPQEKLDLFVGEFQISKPFMQSWLAALGSTSRMLPYAANAPMFKALEKKLHELTTPLPAQSFKLTKDTTFFTATRTVMSAYKTKSTVADVVIFAFVLAHLTLLYVALVGFGPAMNDLQSFLKSLRNGGKDISFKKS